MKEAGFKLGMQLATYFIFLVVKEWGRCPFGFSKGFKDSTQPSIDYPHPGMCQGVEFWGCGHLFNNCGFTSVHQCVPLFQSKSASSAATELLAFLLNLPAKLLISANYNGRILLFLW